MAEDGSTTPASEEHQTPPGTEDNGGSNDGAGAPTPPADAFAEERNKLTTQIRDFQSRADRLQAELDKAKAGTAPEPGPAPAKDNLTAEGVMALLKRDREMTAAVSQLQTDFPFADEAIFTGYDKFESVEAFRAAAESSHTRVNALAEKAAKPLIDAALAPYVEKYGRLSTTPPDNGGAPANGLPSVEEVKGYTQAQLDAFVETHGEDALRRLIYGNTTITP